MTLPTDLRCVHCARSSPSVFVTGIGWVHADRAPYAVCEFPPSPNLVLAAHPILTTDQLRELSIKKYLRGVLIAVDQLGNAIFAGAPDETISSRLNREDIVPLVGSVIRHILNAIDPGHTSSSYEYDDLGLPNPHHLPSLASSAFKKVMDAGDAYLLLPEALLKMAEEDAKLQRLRQDHVNCPTCGRYL